jgi:hypothetical protein
VLWLCDLLPVLFFSLFIELVNGYHTTGQWGFQPVLPFGQNPSVPLAGDSSAPSIKPVTFPFSSQVCGSIVAILSTKIFSFPFLDSFF